MLTELRDTFVTLKSDIRQILPQLNPDEEMPNSGLAIHLRSVQQMLKGDDLEHVNENESSI
jgi:hypothetical protein